MPRKPNYAFERREREKAKAEKKAERQRAKREKSEQQAEAPPTEPAQGDSTRPQDS